MSFEILLLRFEAGDAARFDEPAVHAALERHGQPALVGAKYLTTRDGLDFELSRSDEGAVPHDELMLTTRGISSGLFELVYDLAHAAQLTVVVPDAETTVLVSDASLVAQLPEEYAAKALVCSSATVLASYVLPIYERWRGWAMG